MKREIVVRGARTHNLKNVDVRIPRERLVVITGPSGSGKSSLAFDTIFAEGQRRYVQSLSIQTRESIAKLPAPDVDGIEGLTPTMAIGRASMAKNPRSTVGSSTEIHDALRVLYARVGVPHCPACGIPVIAHPVRDVVDTVLALGDGARVTLLAPILRDAREELADALERLRREGFVRVRFDGELHDLADLASADPRRRHDLDVVVDRIVVREGVRARVGEAVELAYRVGSGRVIVSPRDEPDRELSERPVCTGCGRSLPAPSLALFSWSSPEGACPRCDGIGDARHEAEEAGDDEADVEARSLVAPCESCGGARLREEALAVRVGDVPLGELLRMPLSTARGRLADLVLGPASAEVARPLVAEIESRLAFLEKVGVGYLSLDRASPTLSGGELQRIRLASQLGGGLVGMTYVLDEPTAGLHPRDVDALLDVLEALRDRGNGVLLVEHDAATILRADHVIDLGPGAGPLGGRILAEGTAGEVAAVEDSPTGAYLRRLANPPRPRRRRSLEGPALVLRDVRTHNLRGVDVRFPTGVLTCVTGVSGSGKSSLVSDTLVPWARHVLHGGAKPFGAVEIEGLDRFDRLVAIDASPIGRTPRSNPASYSGVLDQLREVFAALPEARTRGYGKARFSPNVKGGRCEACRGEGLVRVDLRFLADVWVTCDVCGGTRFDRDTLDIRLRGMSIADVLALSVDEASRFFEAYPAISERLETMRRVGLGHVVLGRSATTLSGGEAQRIKLARELGRPGRGRTLYVLDEPTAGLHAVDVDMLVALLDELVSQGHTVIVVEHHLDVVLAADHVVDLGPGGGPDGGRIVAEGTPEEVARAGGATGRALAARLSHVVAGDALPSNDLPTRAPAEPELAPTAPASRPARSSSARKRR